MNMPTNSFWQGQAPSPALPWHPASTLTQVTLLKWHRLRGQLQEAGVVPTDIPKAQHLRRTW